MKTPNYVTTEDCKLDQGKFSAKILPVGTFVRPINNEYLPRHIKESDMYFWIKTGEYVYVYCSYGIVLIPKDIVREV